jgi:hypothetical protein
MNRYQPPTRCLPAAISAIIAVIGTIGCLIIVLENEPESRGVGMISFAAANSAGATITPTATSR